MHAITHTAHGAFVLAENDQAALDVYRSTDGVTWASADAGTSEASPIGRLAWTGGRLIGTAGGSTNAGFEWDPAASAWVPLDAPESTLDFASNGSTEVAVLNSGLEAAFRTPGSTWVSATLLPPRQGLIERVWTVGNRFAISTVSELYLSNDGQTFTQVPLPGGEFDGPLAVLEKNGDELVVSFPSGIYTTTDGAEWARLGSTPNREFARARVLASDGETLYAGSSEGVNAWRVTSGEWEARRYRRRSQLAFFKSSTRCCRRRLSSFRRSFDSLLG